MKVHKTNEVGWTGTSICVLHSAQTRLVMIKTAQARDFLSPWRPKLLWDRLHSSRASATELIQFSFLLSGGLHLSINALRPGFYLSPDSLFLTQGFIC